MEKYLHIIEKSPLFSGVSAGEIEAMLGCLAAETREYEKNGFILRFGDSVSAVGVVLSGSVYVIKEDFWGNRNIMSKAGPGEVFAEAYACSPGKPLGVSVIAGERAEVMFLDVRKILTTC